MATDINQLLSNLANFYNFTGKTILSVGAGGGQLIEYGRNAKQVFAVDNDLFAIEQLQERLEKAGLKKQFTLIYSDFFSVDLQTDVVFFEFSLHEMPDHQAVIEHAFSLAPVVLIADHWPGSEWAYIVNETEKVESAWDAINLFPAKAIAKHDALQVFSSYDELFKKVGPQGKTSIQRIEKFIGKSDFSIPMWYGFALINKCQILKQTV